MSDRRRHRARRSPPVFTGRYPSGIFRFVEGVIRRHNRVIAYAFVLVTDQCPPFRLTA